MSQDAYERARRAEEENKRLREQLNRKQDQQAIEDAGAAVMFGLQAIFEGKAEFLVAPLGEGFAIGFKRHPP